jgi:hypothetical protein
MANVDYDNDGIESDLNREVDRAMRQIDLEPDLPHDDYSLAEIFDLISGIASEIQQVISLIRPKPAMTQPGDSPREYAPQESNCVKAAKDLLRVQVNALQRLAAQLG